MNNAQRKRIEDGCVPFTTFDRIFSTKKLMLAIMAERGIADLSGVTARMLAECSTAVGLKPLSQTMLRIDRRLTLGFTDKALAALKAVSESEDPSIDVQSLSKNLLADPIVTTQLKQHPLEQALFVHIVARFKKRNGKVLRKADLESLRVRAMEAGDLYRRVESVIPRESWTPDFQRCLEDLLYDSQRKWDSWGSSHLKEQEEHIEAIEDCQEER